MKKKSILFVCTRNVFRSMSAEYLFKKYLDDNNVSNWIVGSAGIVAKKEPIDPKTLESLKELGIVNIKHKQRKLTKQMLNKYDIVIAMAENHLNFIEDKLNHRNVILFNELAINKENSIWDIENEVKNYKTDRKAVEKKIQETCNYIFQKIPEFFKNASERYYLFSDFVNNIVSHRNSFPLIKLHKTKNTIAFMSIDIPSKEDGHILVIPKKRYSNLSEIPKNILEELISSVRKIGTAIDTNHGGYNILLNNGVDAGQYIFHSHFHIIPRNYNDGIKIEVWDHKGISKKKFIKLNNILLQQIKLVS